MKQKSELDMTVLPNLCLDIERSDITALLEYIEKIDSKIIVFNGGFLSPIPRNNWQDIQIEPLKKLIEKLKELAASGTKIFYITEHIREFRHFFGDTDINNLEFKNTLLLHYQNSRYWFLPAYKYIRFFKKPRFLRWTLKYRWFRKGIRFLPHGINDQKAFLELSPSANKYLNDFEKIITEKAFERSCDYVICGHAPKPAIRRYMVHKKAIVYMTGGNWFSRKSTLELKNGTWRTPRIVSAMESQKTHLRKTTLDQDQLSRQGKHFFMFPFENRTALN